MAGLQFRTVFHQLQIAILLNTKIIPQNSTAYDPYTSDPVCFLKTADLLFNSVQGAQVKSNIKTAYKS
jgi:hypothetical protein